MNDATDSWTQGQTGLLVPGFGGLTFDEYLNGNARMLVEAGDVGVTIL